MILAGIDIGTNTLRLLVVEAGADTFHELYSDTQITRLGQDLERTGKLSREAIERSLSVLHDFMVKIQEYSAAVVAAVGTSALRKAANTREFIDMVKDGTGIAVTVINGEEEARLTLLGVGKALSGVGSKQGAALESALVLDIGGGSTELIVTDPSSAVSNVSLALGAVYLSERFIRRDPPTEDELLSLRRAMKTELRVLDDIIVKNPRLCAGTAGTITTLAAMDQEMSEYDPSKINGYTLSRASIDRIVEHLAASSLAERRNMRGLEKGREDIILAGAVVAQEIMERYEYTEMLVSDWGLREGIVLDLCEKVKK